MSKTRLKNKFSIGCLLMVLLGCILLGGGLQLRSFSKAKAQVEVQVAGEIAQEYAFGDILTIPESTFTKNGKSAKGIASLQYPNGIQSNQTVATLNQSGKYLLKYIANVDGATYVKEYPFTVFGRLASYHNEKTSLEYGLCTHLGANSMGLTMRIANGDAVTFDHVFDMSNLTMATKLLEGFVVPNVQGTADFTKMVFTFTDIEDPSVQLVYNGNFHNDANAYGLTYFTAGGNGQIQCGLEYVGKLHVGGTLGCMVPHSFIAKDTGLYWGAQAPQNAAPDAKTFCISYDGKSNQAWAGGKIISDLDDSNYYDTMWFGFPSGKAKLTVSALNYNDATANICFTSILGVDLSAKNFIDDEAPMITIDNEYEVMPNAAVGGSYPIPTASALDQVSGACDVNVAVWYNYGTDLQKMVNVTDGRFPIKNIGMYAIVYTATDASGNVAREVLWVRVEPAYAISKLSVTFAEGYPTQAELGELLTLPEAIVSGGVGNASVTYTVSNGKTTAEIVDGTFRLEQAGNWSVICKAVDYVGNEAEKAYVIKGVYSGKPVVIEEPKAPTAYVSGSEYTIPTLYAYDYASGVKVQKTCDVRVEYDGKSATYKAGEKFTPIVSNHLDAVKMVYLSDGAVVLEREVPVAVVFDKERIPGATERYRDIVKVEKYFYTQDGLSFENKYALGEWNGLKISATQAQESAKTTFINPLLANGFSLDFLTVPDESKFTSLIVTLTDSMDSRISIKVTLTKGEGQTALSVGDAVLTLNMDFDGATPTAYNVGFADGKFIVNSTTSIALSKTDSGEEFNGFPSGKVYCSLELVEAEENAAIFLNKICGINVNNTQDNTGPLIATLNNVVTNAFKEDVYTIQGVVVCDMLCPNANAALTVIAPDGNVATSVDGILLENVDATKSYQVKMSAYGSYNVAVTATEVSAWKYSNKSYFEYAVTVIDGEKPTITFKDDFKTEIKVGDLLKIPEYEVADNFTASDKITVMTLIINPKGMPVYLYDSNSLRCEYAGEYKIYIYVYDEMGNLTIVEKTVTVKGD